MFITSDSGSITERSPQNLDTPVSGYKLVLTQIGDTGEESAVNEMLISFPDIASDPQSEKRQFSSRPTNQCIVM
jgi:hypothetical protein